jgi:hypothetical protein
MSNRKRIFSVSFVVVLLLLFVGAGIVAVKVKISKNHKAYIQQIYEENKKKYEMELRQQYIEQARIRQLDQTKMTNTSPNKPLEPTATAP